MVMHVQDVDSQLTRGEQADGLWSLPAARLTEDPHEWRLRYEREVVRTTTICQPASPHSFVFLWGKELPKPAPKSGAKRRSSHAAKWVPLRLCLKPIETS